MTEEHIEWYKSVTENWKYGENQTSRGDTDLGPMKCPCGGTELIVEPEGYYGEFHSRVHHLRARCKECNATLAIGVRPIAVVSFGSRNPERRKGVNMDFKQGRQIGWTKEDVKILKDNYYKLSKEEMMKLLPGRSWSAIQGKVYRLGL